MSRVGQKVVEIPAGVNVKVDGKKVTIKGPLGELEIVIPDRLDVKVEGQKVGVVRGNDSAECKSLHGLTRTLILNMISGVVKGFLKELEIQGVGFKAVLQGQNLVFNLGYSSPIEYVIPAGIKVSVKDGVLLGVQGADKQKVGEVAAHIRSFYPVEPYKGKGIRYKNEYVRRKAGKTVA
jgi:large subunit ribosomal protein L6